MNKTKDDFTDSVHVNTCTNKQFSTGEIHINLVVLSMGFQFVFDMNIFCQVLNFFLCTFCT